MLELKICHVGICQNSNVIPHTSGGVVGVAVGDHVSRDSRIVGDSGRGPRQTHT